MSVYLPREREGETDLNHSHNFLCLYVCLCVFFCFLVAYQF
uniref:Uncharacterized protein n=1 Tax=Anguilla anguilla TaxID=7936 RepID=A0A0E9QEL3_ANGAN